MIALLPLAAAGTYSVLFLGNSHTAFNDVPGMVGNILRANGAQVAIETKTAMHLDGLNTPQMRTSLESGRYTHVVMQGQMISMSHRIDYPIDGAVALARSAKAGRTKSILYSEWPRRGIDETAYIEGIYAKIAKATDAEISPVGRVWDRVLASGTRDALWAPDGNHAEVPGSYVAAATLARSIGGPSIRLKWAPRGVGSALVEAVSKAVSATLSP